MGDYCGVHKVAHLYSRTYIGFVVNDPESRIDTMQNKLQTNRKLMFQFNGICVPVNITQPHLVWSDDWFYGLASYDGGL